MKDTTKLTIAPDDPRVVHIAQLIAALLPLAAVTPNGTTDELVAVTSMGEAHGDLRRRIRRGELDAVKLGRRWYVRRSDLAGLAHRQEPSVATTEDAKAHTPEAAYMRLVGSRRSA